MVLRVITKIGILPERDFILVYLFVDVEADVLGLWKLLGTHAPHRANATCPEKLERKVVVAGRGSIEDDCGSFSKGLISEEEQTERSGGRLSYCVWASSLGS